MTSKLFVFFAIPIISLVSCNSNNNEKNSNPDVVIEDTVFDPPTTGGDSVIYIKNKSLLWQVDDDEKLQKPKVAGIDTMPVQNVIQLINNTNDSIHLDYVKTSHDTIYVHIPRSEVLTQRIGTTGAEIYMASTTWSLTALKGIKYVNYDFEEGDHASPGVYKRDSFKSFE